MTCTSSSASPSAGGLLRYGIPDFKMEKRHIDRRVAQMEPEGVVLPLRRQCRRHEVLRRARRRVRRRAPGRRRRRPAGSQAAWPGPGRRALRHALPGAAEPPRGRGRASTDEAPILAGGKHVVVIGGGDTASDCVGTSFRQGALSVTQLDIRPKPPMQGGQAGRMAVLADQDAHLVQPGRGRGA